MKYTKYFGAKEFIKSKIVLAPKGAIHLLNENIRYDIQIVLFVTDITKKILAVCPSH
jgi:hypothetical protein